VQRAFKIAELAVARGKLAQAQRELEEVTAELAECERIHGGSSSAQAHDVQVSGSATGSVTWTSGFCSISSFDPNSKIGNSGVGKAGYVRGLTPLPYVINFENLPTASAPAARVSVTDRLDPNLDWTTFFLKSISFGNTFIQAPQGAQQFTKYVDLRPDKNLIVGIQTDVTSGVFNLLFVSIDPATGKPLRSGSIDGFLDPGQSGSVAFTVTPKEGGRTQTRIKNQATIVFDTNAPISTPVWSNRLDNTNPSSHVLALPATESCPNFKVRWSDTDEGAGTESSTVFVSDNGGPFAPWLTNTAKTSATFKGQAGHSYGFYSIARDLVGNVEAAKTSAEATTQVNSDNACGPPSLSGRAGVTWFSGGILRLNLQLTNTGSGDAQNTLINHLTFRTIGGAGTVTLAAPTLPISVGNLSVGTSTTLTLALNVPSTVAAFSITENGTMQDDLGKLYNYSIGQAVFR
jgi:hypothetical protein